MRSTGSFFLIFIASCFPGLLFAANPNLPLRPGQRPPSDTAPEEIKKVIANFSDVIRANPNDVKALTSRGKAYAAIQELN